MIFLKLGGSVITDKTHESAAHEDVIRRLAREVKEAQASVHPTPGLVLGHGSGSFGHFAAHKYGYAQPGNWSAYAETGASAGRLNRLVTDIFLAQGVPVVSFQPSASALCRDGELIRLAYEPIAAALANGLVPLVYGDVSFDETRGRTIISTEMIFAYLASFLHPSHIVLAGVVEGVFTADPLRDPSAQLIREITPHNIAKIESQLRGSHGVDVTGGMLTKVKTMLRIVERDPVITARLLTASREGVVRRAVQDPGIAEGTLIHAGSK